MTFEQRIGKLEKEIGRYISKGTHGTTIGRFLGSGMKEDNYPLKGGVSGWFIAFGQISMPKKVYYGRTISEALKKAEKEIL